jgi:tetratricopeptide (TPR) repeat protein
MNKEGTMEISRKRTVIFFLLLLFPLLIYAQTEESLQILELNKKGVITLIAFGENKEEITRGTGFSVKENMLIATSYHLVSNAYSAQGLNFKGKKIKVEGIIAVDKDLNIAILKIKGKLPALLLGNSDEFGMGKRIFALASNETQGVTVSEGTILDLVELTSHQRVFSPSLFFQESSSGGPLLDISGRALGLNTAIGTGLQFTTPINKIKPLIKMGKVTAFKNWSHEDYLSTLEGALLAGRFFSHADEPGKAIEYLRKVIKARPDDPEIHMHIALAYTKVRYYDSAISSFKKVIQLDENRSEAHFGLGMVYAKMRRFENSISPLEKAVQLNPKNMEAYYQLANAYEELRDFSKAAEMYKSYLSLKPETTWNGYLRLGLCYLEIGQFEDSISALKEALKEKPDNVKINYNLAEAYSKAGQYDKAYETYEYLTKIDPKSTTTYYEKIFRMYDQTGQYDKAIEAAKKIVELNPESELAIYNLGIMYSKAEKHQMSIDTFNQALKVRPNYDLAYFNIGLSYFKLKKFKEAVESFKKYVEISPDNADAWHNMAVGYMQLKKFDSALEPLRKSIELRPDYSAAYYNLAICYLNLKDNYSAREVYNQLRSIDSAMAQKLKKYIK